MIRSKRKPITSRMPSPGMEQLCGIAGCWIDGRRTTMVGERHALPTGRTLLM
jgi:hypothetical protein